MVKQKDPNSPQTLTGYLGSDIEIRDSEARWEAQEAKRWDPIAEMEISEETERYRRSRPYGRVSLATHTWQDGRQITRWHQLVIWDLHRIDRFNVRLGRKGDRVRVEGFAQVFRFTTGEGEARELERFVVTRYQMLRRKCSNGIVLSPQHLDRDAPEAASEVAEASISGALTPRRESERSRRPTRSSYTVRVAVEAEPVTRGEQISIEVRSANGSSFRASAPRAGSLGEAIAWLQAGDTVRLSFRRLEGRAPELCSVEWDPMGGIPSPRRADRRQLPATSSPGRSRPAQGEELTSELTGALATEPETLKGWRVVAVETDGGELLRVGAQVGSAAGGELARLQEGDRVRLEGRRLAGERFHASSVKPLYLRGSVPRFPREQQEVSELEV